MTTSDLSEYSTQQLAYKMKASIGRITRWEIYINGTPTTAPNFPRIAEQLSEETALMYRMAEELQFRRNGVS